MMTQERMDTFLNALDREEPAWLEDLWKSARAQEVPVIRRETGGLLRFLLALTRPASILEVGTAVGFSALYMSEYMPAGCHITTIEKEKERIDQARQNVSAAGRLDRITLLEGDALELLTKLQTPFDFIFMDAAKGQYPRFLPEALRLLNDGGLLVSDNVLQEGTVLESRYAVTRRDRTIHTRMRDYLYELKRNPALETVILPLGDGVSVSVRKVLSL